MGGFSAPRRISSTRGGGYLVATKLLVPVAGVVSGGALVRKFRQPVVFTGQLVFQRENLFTRSLHQETAFAI